MLKTAELKEKAREHGASITEYLTAVLLKVLVDQQRRERPKKELPVALALEAAVVLAEGACYARTENSIRYPWLFSLCANAFSFSCGLLLQILF